MTIRKDKIPLYLVMGLMPLIFWLLSHAHSGPTYSDDEIGYLTKAALLGGHVIDGGSSYYGGYSIFLSPLFFFFNSSQVIWLGVISVNALFWLGSFYLLNRLIGIWNPEISRLNRFFSLLISTLYPTWITLSSYAFPTSAFVFIFLCCVLTLINWREAPRLTTLLPHSLSIGFLYWIHPTGLGVALASIVSIMFICKVDRNYGFLVHTILVMFLIIFYTLVLQPWLNQMMTPPGNTIRLHYPSILSMCKKFFDFSFLQFLILRIIGQVSYVVIASFGLILFGIVDCILKLKNHHKRSEVALFLIISLFLVMCMGAALFFNEMDVFRIDRLIFGRYVDGVVIPLLAIGFLTLCQWKKNIRFLSTLIAAAFLTFMIFISIVPADTSKWFNNLINTPAFYPQYIFENFNIAKWMLTGLDGVLIAAFFGEYAALALMVGSFILSTNAQLKWNHSLSIYTQAPSIIDFVKINFVPGTCIGFDNKMPKNVTYNLDAFFLFNYAYKRMNIEKWRSDCDGPLLTFNPQVLEGGTTEYIIARTSPNLFLVVKNSNDRIKIPEELRSRGDTYYGYYPNDPCVVKGCFSFNANKLSKLSEVGSLHQNQLSSNGKAGFLFYGPYLTLDKGKYYLILKGNFSAANSVIIDIVSNMKIHYRSKLCPQKCRSNKLIIPFQLEEKTPNLEIRLRVETGDEVGISSYEIVDQSKNPAIQKLLYDQVS